MLTDIHSCAQNSTQYFCVMLIILAGGKLFDAEHYMGGGGLEEVPVLPIGGKSLQSQEGIPIFQYWILAPIYQYCILHPIDNTNY